MTAPVRRVPDVVYGEVPGYRPLELDLYLPEATGPLPVIVHVHGGGWRRGSRRHPLPALGPGFYDDLAGQGFAVAAIDYRLSGEARFPAPLEDVRTAIGWVGDHGASYGLDPGRVFGWGDSAGGHLALLAALTGDTVHGAMGPGSGVQGVVAWFPVPDLARLASPVAHASAAAPPVLLMHGAADDLVPPAQSVRLAGALRAAGATVELELVPGATHFCKGASDVPGIVRRSVEFLRAITP